MKLKNKRLFWVCLFIIFLITLLFPRGNYDISNAIVNEENGDIAFSCFYESEDSYKIKIFQFSKDGELLFTEELSSPGSNPSLLFRENQLYVMPARTQTIYSFDRNGNPAGNAVSVKELQETYSFDGWKQSLINKKYTWGEYVYCYEGPTLFRYKASLTITYGDSEKIQLYKASQKWSDIIPFGWNN